MSEDTCQLLINSPHLTIKELSSSQLFFKLTLRAKPNAKKNLLSFDREKGFILAITAIAEGERANDEIVDYISSSLKIKKSQVIISKGLTSRNKHLEINLILTSTKDKNYYLSQLISLTKFSGEK